MPVAGRVRRPDCLALGTQDDEGRACPDKADPPDLESDRGANL